MVSFFTLAFNLATSALAFSISLASVEYFTIVLAFANLSLIAFSSSTFLLAAATLAVRSTPLANSTLSINLFWITSLESEVSADVSISSNSNSSLFTIFLINNLNLLASFFNSFGSTVEKLNLK